MSLNGKVVGLENGWATVEVTPNPSCTNCKVCSGLFSSDDEKSPRQVKALVGEHILELGDQVKIDTYPGEASLAAFLVFGFPMFSLVLGIFAAGPLFSKFGLVPKEWHSIFLGIIGLGLSFGIIYILSKWGFFNNLSFKVMEKIK